MSHALLGQPHRDILRSAMPRERHSRRRPTRRSASPTTISRGDSVSEAATKNRLSADRDNHILSAELTDTHESSTPGSRRFPALLARPFPMCIEIGVGPRQYLFLRHARPNHGRTPRCSVKSLAKLLPPGKPRKPYVIAELIDTHESSTPGAGDSREFPAGHFPCASK